MTQPTQAQWPPPATSNLPDQFLQLGWLGIIVQLALIAMELVLTVYVVTAAGGSDATTGGFGPGHYLSLAGVIVMLFTTLWFFRYTRLGYRMSDPYECPPYRRVVTTLWIGLWASLVGIAFSLIVLFLAAGRMLFVLLATPQTGLLIGNAGTPEAGVGAISAIDAVSLSGLLVVLSAELLVMGLTLWLLFRTTRLTAG